MATLTAIERIGVWRDFMQSMWSKREETGLSKADIKAAVDALDDFLNTNAASINTAIPQPARGALSITQKALLLMYVIQRRYLTGA